MWRWLAVCCGALLIGWLAWDRMSERSSDGSIEHESSGSVSLQWRSGTSQRYQLQVNSSMITVAGSASVTPDLRVQIDAVLDSRTLDSDGDSALVGLQLSSITLQVAGKSDQDTNLALSAPFRVRFVSGGVPDTFEFSAATAAQHRVILKNLVQMFQVTMQQDTDWTTREQTAVGSYEAVYNRTDPNRVQRTKRSFVGLPSEPLYKDAELTSSDTVQVDQQHDWVIAVSIDEKIQTSGKSGPVVKITNLATLNLQTTAPVVLAPDIWEFTAAIEPLAETSTQANQNGSPKQQQEQAHAQLLSDVSVLDSTSQGRTLVIHRLRDLLRSDDALPAALLQTMQVQQLSDRTRADLYLAFELAGTASAQSALASVVADTSWSARDAMRAIVALGGVANPTTETLSALWDGTQSDASGDGQDQIASTATFALGSIGKTLRTDQSEEYSTIRLRLMDGALNSATATQRANFAHALGNTQDATLASDMMVLLDDATPAVRRAAALSVGMVGADPVADEMISRMGQEPSSAVRGAMAEALVSWTNPSDAAMDIFRSAIRDEQDENARYNLSRILISNMSRFPENKQLLQQLVRTEPSKRIRQSIGEAFAKSK